MNDDFMNKFESTLHRLFVYEDNKPSTYVDSNRLQDSVKSYLFNPLVKMKRLTKNRLDLLLRLGEYVYGMEGKPDQAFYPFEMAVDLASRLFPTLSGSPELASAHEWLGRCYLLMAKSKEAELHFQKGLEVRIGIYGEDHPETA
jgi:hypothetical protein